MSIEIIDTLKQKNSGAFPIVEAMDVAVTAAKRLNQVLDEKADLTDIAGKASTAALELLGDNLQSQINELITPVTQDAEVENARVDSAGTVYDTLKERLDYFERLVKEDFQQFGSSDASFDDKAKINFTHNGITYSYDSIRNKYKISGTATAKSFYNALAFQDNDIPDYIEKGEINYIHFATTNTDIVCAVYEMKTGDSEYTQIATIHGGEVGAVMISETAENLLIRFEVANGKTIEAYAYANLAVVDGMTNQQLSVSALKNTYTILPACDLNDISGNNIYLLVSTNSYAHAPAEAGALICNDLAAGWKVQFVVALRNSGFYKRDYSPVAQSWSDWTQIGVQCLNALGSSTTQPLSQKFITDNSSSFPKDTTAYTTTDPQTGTISLALSNIKDAGYFMIDSSWVILDAPSGSRVTGCKVEKYKAGNNQSFMKQTVETVSGNTNYPSYFRYTNVSGEYQEWKPCGRTGFIFAHPEVLPNNTDLNDLSGDSTWLLANASGGNPLRYYHAPWYNSSGEAVGILVCNDVCGWHFQIYYNFSNGNTYRRFGSIANHTWRDWIAISGGGDSITYNVTQNINRDEISNTYNITTTPTITTDDNGWLQPVDTNTSSEVGKTDMSGAIMSMLTDTGYCHLAAGIYYVSSAINMPEGATLEGCGKKTIIRLLSSVTSGYTVRIGQNNTVKNICFSGGYSAPSDVTTENTNLGSRHGVYLIGNADGEESSQPTTKTNIVTGCFFENYDGSAYYNHNTGGGMDNAVIMTDCRIVDCKVGLNIDYYGEYSKFTSIVIRGCNHACINNGGNNVFTGCTFHGVVGFLIDNTSGDMRNIAHGSCVGCTFNHINNANNPSQLGMGDAILVKNAANGFLFNDSQIWYGKINIQNSQGVSINNALIGGGTPNISVVGDYGAFFRGCTFMQMPSISANSKTKFDNCYLASTSAAIINQ